MTKDSGYALLKEIEKGLQDHPSLPDSLKAYNHYLLGLHFQRLSQMDSAAFHFQRATNFVNDSTHLKQNEGYYFAYAWDAYHTLGLYGDCTIIAEKYKSLLPENEYRGLSWYYYWKQRVYRGLGDMEKVLEMIDERIRVAEKGDSASLTPALIDKAQIQYSHFKNWEASRKIYELLLEKADTSSIHDQQAIYRNYGIFLYYKGKFEKSLHYYLKELQSLKDTTYSTINVFNAIANSYNNIAEVSIDLKQYDDARKYLDSVKLMGINKVSRDIQKAFLSYELRLAVESGGGLSEINNFLNDIYDHQDEIQQQKSKNELLALTQANEKEKILLLEKQNTEIKNIRLQSFLAIAGVSLMAVLGFGLLYNRQRKLNFQQQGLQMQQRLLRSQMNPHFTFNTLYAIQSQIKKEPEAASNYLNKFSRLLRLFLENSMEDHVSLQQEIDSLRKYMDLRLMRSPIDFEYHFHYENLKEDEALFIPPMLLQPFVENSIDHGFLGIGYKGRIDIRLTLQDRFVLCEIEDNGNGLSRARVEGKKSASTRLIADFIKKTTKKELEMIDRKSLDPNKSGVMVCFPIPYQFGKNN